MLVIRLVFEDGAMKKWQSAVYPFISLACVLLIWFVASEATGSEYLLPSPTATIARLFEIVFGETGEFWLAVAQTVLHAFVSFVLAFVFALILAVAASVSRTVERVLSPIVITVRVAPTMSVIFLSFLWVDSKNSPYLVGVFVLFPMLYSRILSAITSVDGDLLEMARVYEVKRSDVVRYLYLPHVAGTMADECPGLLSFGIKLAVSGEAVAQSGINLGSLMQSSKANYDTAALVAYTVAAILVGFLLERLLKAIIGLCGRRHYAKVGKNK